MATPVLAGDAILVTTNQVGTGTYQLGNAVLGYFHPSDNPASLDGARVGYSVVDSLTAPTVREVGEGVLASGSPWTLTRAQIRRTTSNGIVGASAINWPSGTKFIYIALLSANAIQRHTDGRIDMPATGLSAPLWGGTAGGTANARTVALDPVVTTWGAGLAFAFRNGAAANTGAATITPNAGVMAPKNILRPDGSALLAGDLPANGLIEVFYEPTADACILRRNPHPPAFEPLPGYPVSFSGVSSVDITVPTGVERIFLDITASVAASRFLGLRINMGAGFLAGAVDYAIGGIQASGASPSGYSQNSSSIWMSNNVFGGNSSRSEISLEVGSTGRSPSAMIRSHYVNAAGLFEVMQSGGFLTSGAGRATAFRIAVLNADGMTGRLMAYGARN